MGTSVFFNNYKHTLEQDLYEDLVIESIRIYGQDVLYIPRTLNNFDELYTEDTISSYDDSYQIEMYVKSVDGFSGDGVFLSKFGLEIRDQVVFTVSKRVFENTITKVDSTRNVPKEGDIIYFPLNKKPFQIKFVDYKPFFYQLGELQTYDLVCELFEYSGEDFNTGNTEVDIIQDNYDLDVYPHTILDEEGAYLLTENGEVILREEYDIQDAEPTADNDFIQDEAIANGIFDFTELDPFSQGEY